MKRSGKRRRTSSRSAGNRSSRRQPTQTPRPLADEARGHTMQSQQIHLLRVLISTKIIVGRCTASATASASRQLFLRNGLTCCAGIRRTSGYLSLRSDCAPLIQPSQVECVLAEVDPDRGDVSGAFEMYASH